MGDLCEVDHDLDRISIREHSAFTCPFIPGHPAVNPIGLALDAAEMPNQMRSDGRFWIQRGGRTAVYSVSDTVEHWLSRWTAMAQNAMMHRFKTARSDDARLAGSSLVVDHGTRFIHAESPPDTYHRIVLTAFDRMLWVIISIIEE